MWAILVGAFVEMMGLGLVTYGSYYVAVICPLLSLWSQTGDRAQKARSIPDGDGPKQSYSLYTYLAGVGNAG